MHLRSEVCKEDIRLIKHPVTILYTHDLHELQVIPVFVSIKDILNNLKNIIQVEEVKATKAKPKILHQEILSAPIQIEKYKNTSGQQQDVIGRICVFSNKEKTVIKKIIGRKTVMNKEEVVDEENKDDKVNFLKNTVRENIRNIKKIMKSELKCRTIDSKDEREDKNVKKKKVDKAQKIPTEARVSQENKIKEKIQKERKRLKFERENKEWKPYQLENKNRNKLKKSKENKQNQKSVEHRKINETCKKKVEIKVKKLSEKEIKNWDKKEIMRKEDKVATERNGGERKSLLDKINGDKKELEDSQQKNKKQVIKEELLTEEVVTTDMISGQQFFVTMEHSYAQNTTVDVNNEHIETNDLPIQESLEFTYIEYIYDEDLLHDEQMEELINMSKNKEIETSVENIIPTSSEFMSINEYLNKKVDKIIDTTIFDDKRDTNSTTKESGIKKN